MAINISGMTPPVRSSGQTGRVGSPDKLPGAGMPDQPVKEPDELRLTPETLRLRKLETALSKEPAFDQERVEALRKAIVAGEYQVNSTRIASKIIDFESELSK